MTKFTSRLFVLSSVALLSLGSASSVLAGKHAEPLEKQQYLEQAVAVSKITLVQAIEIAQQKAEGTVLEAEFHPRREHHPVYDIEILTKEKQIKEVRIDAVTSEILRNDVKERKPHHHKKHKD
ncbi:PepSY domain-containing protein [Gallibacterium trehalosifermentans]|uniref:PepSY domain-containing protein n=1 Tax=Gallibacterium trehalosifermentans TaxID=516935 RepID=A0ABV6H011_9PAST